MHPLIGKMTFSRLGGNDDVICHPHFHFITYLLTSYVILSSMMFCLIKSSFISLIFFCNHPVANLLIFTIILQKLLLSITTLLSGGPSQSPLQRQDSVAASNKTHLLLNRYFIFNRLQFQGSYHHLIAIEWGGEIANTLRDFLRMVY